jgi:4-amino-4-deoxy-L-arabinose transferase-like glycosyltransferase
VALFSIIALGTALRLAWLGSHPPGINQDEAMRAYDAWCLLNTGKDHHGNSWPIFLRAFGEYHPGALIYLLIPFQALLGMNVWSTRLPSALLGVISIPAWYAALRPYYGRRTGLLAALLLAISPWHLILSRMAFEVSICVPLLILCAALLARSSPAGDGRRTGSAGLLAAGFLLGLCSWTYNAMRVFVPVLAAVAAIGAAPWRGAGGGRLRRHAGPFILGLGIALLPFLYASITSPREVWRRAATEVLRGEPGAAASAVLGALRVYALQLSPSFLFTEGDPSPAQSIPGHGMLQPLEAVFLCAGILRVFLRRRQEPIGRMILLWLLAAPLPAALTRLEAGHALRSAAAIPACAALSAIGLDYLLHAVRRWRPRLQRPASILVTILLAGMTLNLAKTYFRDYAKSSSAAFEPEWDAVAREVIRRQADYDLVLLSPEGSDQNGVLFLFWSAMPPADYFSAPRSIQQVGGWDYLLQAGKYFFVSGTELASLIDQLPPEVTHPRVLVAERPHIPVAGRELARFFRPDGAAAMILYEVTFPPR